MHLVSVLFYAKLNDKLFTITNKYEESLKKVPLELLRTEVSEEK